MLATFLHNAAKEISQTTLKLSSPDFDNNVWSEAIIHLNLHNEAHAGISLFTKPHDNIIQLKDEQRDLSCSFWYFNINEETITSHVRDFSRFTSEVSSHVMSCD